MPPKKKPAPTKATPKTTAKTVAKTKPTPAKAAKPVKATRAAPPAKPAKKSPHPLTKLRADARAKQDAATASASARPTRTVNALANFVLLAVTSLTPSPTNPRKRFDAVKLAELAESIREQGVLEPILVRPIGRGHEIVAGERRWRAAALAELAEVPCLVRELSDDAVLEVQVAENIQREDMTALEEADAFAALAARGRSASDIADRIGRKTRYVEQRLAVARAHESVRALLEADMIGLGSALLIVAFDHEAQARIAESLAGRGRMTVNDVIEELSDWNHALRGAPFDVEDAQLVPNAGACGACPKNSASQLSLLGEVDRNATCLDDECWQTKAAAAWALVKADADARGIAIVETDNTYNFTKAHETAWALTEARAQTIDPRSADEDDLDDLDLEGDEDLDGDEQSEADEPSARSWAALAPDAKRVLVRDKRTGRVFEALAPGEKERILQEHGVKSVTGDATLESNKSRAARDKAKAVARTKSMTAVVEYFETASSTDVWPLLARAILHSNDVCGRIAKRRGIETGGGTYFVGALRKHLKTLTPTEARGLVFEYILDTAARYHNDPIDPNCVEEDLGADVLEEDEEGISCAWIEALRLVDFNERGVFEEELAAATALDEERATKKAAAAAKKAAKSKTPESKEIDL